MPGKVVRQVLGSYAAQAALYPRLELLVIVVGGLDVERLVRMAVVASHEVFRLHPQRRVQAQKRRVAVRADDRLAWLDRVLEGGGHLHPIELDQHLVHGVRLPSNPSDQDGHPVPRLAAGALGPATAVPRGPGELAGPLLGLPKVGFVDLQQAHHAFGLVRDDALEEPVPPPKGLIHSQAHPGCGGPHRQPLAHAVGIGIELLLVPKAAQRCAGGGVESPEAAPAKVPLEPVANAIADHLLAQAVRTGMGLERIHRAWAEHRRGRRAERFSQLLALRRREAGQPGEQ